MGKSLCPAQNQGLTLGFLHGLSEVQGALDIDLGFLALKTLEHTEHTLVGFAIAVYLAVDLVLQAFFLRGAKAAFCNGSGHIGSSKVKIWKFWKLVVICCILRS